MERVYNHSRIKTVMNCGHECLERRIFVGCSRLQYNLQFGAFTSPSRRERQRVVSKCETHARSGACRARNRRLSPLADVLLEHFSKSLGRIVTLGVTAWPYISQDGGR